MLTIGIGISFGLSCKTSKKTSINPSVEIKTPFEKDDNYSSSYQEAIDYYDYLSRKFSQISMTANGLTDSGRPLHEIVISDTKISSRAEANASDKLVLMVNNAIHPGEPCGIDASLMLARDLADTEEGREFLQDIVVVIIPVYNISGSLNRGSFSRANQVGPEAYGFRGNVRNYDLNRDFIKCDTKNAQSFNPLYQKWMPDIFIDNHTSNGADYQYVMTLIPTQKEKLGDRLGEYMEDKMLPDLYRGMKKDGYEMTPYVNARNTLDEGIYGFLDLPRYSSGYAALHHAFSFMPETHMLKPYKERVWSTYYFMMNMLRHCVDHKDDIRKVRTRALEEYVKEKNVPISWSLDIEEKDEISFKGYAAKYKPSEISGQSRLYYDRKEPYEKKIPFYNTYKSDLTIEKPKAYIVPQSYRNVIDRLQWNGVEMRQLTADTVMEVEMYFIEEYKSRNDPYEGHYLHTDVAVRKEKVEMAYFRGDYFIPTRQNADRYLIETLEPQAPDSYFAWNFMDAILQRKEYFSAYVFEDLAVEILKKDRRLRNDFEEKKKNDPDFAGNPRAQLFYIYERSPYAEPSYRRYPIGRLVD